MRLMEKRKRKNFLERTPLGETTLYQEGIRPAYNAVKNYFSNRKTNELVKLQQEVSKLQERANKKVQEKNMDDQIKALKEQKKKLEGELYPPEEYGEEEDYDDGE